MRRNLTVAIAVAVLLITLGGFGASRSSANAQSSVEVPTPFTRQGRGDWTVVLQSERSKGNGDVNGYLVNTRTGEAFFLSNEKKRLIRGE